MKLRWGRKGGSRAKKASSNAGQEDGRNGGNSAGGLTTEVQDDEVFFDPRAWPESDGEDDFYSVNGDLTPSRLSTPSRSCGNTPKHHAFSPRTSFPTTNGASVTDADVHSKPEATPKTRFGSLLQEPNLGAAGSPVARVTNGESLPSDGSEPGGSGRRRASSERRSGMGLQCCLPGLGRSKRRPAIEKEDA